MSSAVGSPKPRSTAHVVAIYRYQAEVDQMPAENFSAAIWAWFCAMLVLFAFLKSSTICMDECGAASLVRARHRKCKVRCA